VRRAGKMVGDGSRAMLTRARQSVAALSATSARRGSSRGGSCMDKRPRTEAGERRWCPCGRRGGEWAKKGHDGDRVAPF
jgi:hypothetical protein